MINLMIGASGGGKSYETVVYHILQALKAGRMVITNMPLNVDEFCLIEPSFRELIVLRHKSKDPNAAHPFSVVQDYEDDWKHPDTGDGPFYVVDEAQKVIPRGQTARAVDEWYAEHRHARTDVMLISQSIGKLSKAIVDNAQIMYKVRKAVALGKPNHYIRKVYDGPRGYVIDESQREYLPQYFRLYKSHTRANGGMEALAHDISPAYKRWAKYSYVTMIVGVFILVRTFWPSSDGAGDSSASARTEEHAVGTVSSSTPKPRRPQTSNMSSGYDSYSQPTPTPTPTPTPDPRERGPFGNLGIHVAGHIETEKGEQHYLFQLTQNGQTLRYLTTKEMNLSGYEVEPQGPCAAKITYDETWQFASCSAGTVSMVTSVSGR